MPFSIKLTWAELTDDLAISVAITLRNCAANGTVKLPLPQYSSNKSGLSMGPKRSTFSQAQEIICSLTPALG